MLEDTFESLEDDDLEEAADEEVEKILFEVTAGKHSILWLYKLTPLFLANVDTIFQVFLAVQRLLPTHSR